MPQQRHNGVSCRTGTRAGAGTGIHADTGLRLFLSLVVESACSMVMRQRLCQATTASGLWTVDCTQSMQLPVLPVAQTNNNLIFNRIMQALINTPTQAIHTQTHTHSCSHILGPLN